MTINTNAIHSRKLLLLSNNNRLISLRKSDESYSLFLVSRTRPFQEIKLCQKWTLKTFTAKWNKGGNHFPSFGDLDPMTYVKKKLCSDLSFDVTA